MKLELLGLELGSLELSACAQVTAGRQNGLTAFGELGPPPPYIPGSNSFRNVIRSFELTN